MNKSEFQRTVRERFGELLDCNAEAQRSALEEIALDDPAIAREVRALLQAHSSAGAFLDAPGARLVERLSRVSEAPIDNSGPPQIDGFRIERLLGRGNFGEVWLATQLEFEREVAIKLLACERVSSSGRARFRREVTALARMNHPSIARVFEAGVAEDGRPWFSMEVVRGVPLTKWCDEAQASLRERITLVERVCHAIHHAHQLGILHRDLKPNNVLVTEVDGTPVPQVIDFGLSVTMVDEDSDADAARSMSLGTPLYMAPEQASQRGIVDTRLDVYGLGALLSEVLSGSPPIDLSRDEGSSLDKILDSVNTSPRRLPSAIIASLGDERALIAERRRMNVTQLMRAVSGDLDSITGRATAFDACQRYDTVLELSRDLRAYLEHRPVSARGDDRWYRLSRFVRRHLPIVATASIVFVASSIAATVAIRGHLRSLRADASARESAYASEEVSRLLERLILAPHPELQGRDVTMLEVVRTAERELIADPPERPLTEARVRSALGTALLGLGDAERAEFELRRAIELLESLPPQPGNDLVLCIRQRGQALIQLGRASEAEEILRRGLSLAASDETSAITLGLRLTLGMALRDLGSTDESVEEWQQVVDGSTVLGATHIDVLSARLLLAQTRVFSESPDVVREEIESLVEAHQQRFGEQHPKTLGSQWVLGVLRERQGRFTDAESLFRKVLEARERQLGETHPKTLETLSSLASALRMQGQANEALGLLQRALETQLETLGADHQSTIKTRSSLAGLLAETGNAKESVREFREVYEQQRKLAGDDHPDTLGYLTNLANALQLAGEADEARPLHREAYERKVEVLGPEHPQTLSSMSNLASNLRSAGEFEERVNSSG